MSHIVAYWAAIQHATAPDDDEHDRRDHGDDNCLPGTRNADPDGALTLR